MRLFTSGVCCTVAATLLAACAGNNGSTLSAMPGAQNEMRSNHRREQGLSVSVVPPWKKVDVGIKKIQPSGVQPAVQRDPLYASEYSGSEVYGYSSPRHRRQPPTCAISGDTDYVNGIASDPNGNLIIPGAYGASTNPFVSVYQGPGPCGSILGAVADTTGEAADASSLNAASGNILVGEIYNFTTGLGDVVMCTLAGCGTPLAVPSQAQGYAAGVALAPNGDCWMSGETGYYSGFVLVYWPGCTGTGQVATVTSGQSSYGGLFFDRQGNLVSVDAFSDNLYVYSGCNPVCSNVGGPFPLQGLSVFGNLSYGGKRLALGDYSNNDVDVYSYTPTGLSYRYSFSQGLTAGDTIESGIFARSNPVP